MTRIAPRVLNLLVCSLARLARLSSAALAVATDHCYVLKDRGQLLPVVQLSFSNAAFLLSLVKKPSSTHRTATKIAETD